MDNEENLPAVPEGEGLEINIPYPEVRHHEPNVADTTIMKNNAETATFQLQVIAELWKQPKSFSRILRLLKEQRTAIEFRSDALGIQFGHKGDSAKRNEFTPLD
jgi:hypothetical protein